MNDYLENYIIAEQKEQHRIESYWYIWIRSGWMWAMFRDTDIVKDWGILE